MTKNQSIMEVIQKRYSCRTFKGEPLTGQALLFLNQLGADNWSTPFRNVLRFQRIAGTKESMEAMKGIGTYGVIKAPAGFIVGAVQKGPFDLEAFGYAME